MSAGDWCLIESDPGVFSELIKKFGVTGIQVEELWSLDEENFTNLRPVHGLIFLFKWKTDVHRDGKVVTDGSADHIYFAKQVINNACASQAIINILANVEHKDVSLGSTLTELRDFTMSFDPQMKGLSISNSENIREVHNSFSRQQLFELDEKSSKPDDDVFHFVGYLPVNGRLYELDGLQEGPIDHGAIPEKGDWLSVAKPVIEQRIGRYAADEIHFNLMALVSDRLVQAERKIELLKQAGMDESSEEVKDLRDSIKTEKMKREKSKVENVRRRHNYLPFIVELLKTLASQGKLVDLVSEAKDKTVERQKAKKRKVAV
ncbi:ubiquitin carboxyl-terminal hydrolase isozyme L5-like [Watersipora subatra]|uniref:ubiquitin carboxyl-terminal hydrolase isozyme L5-like n=1 Tax=Watersipora subatra TaxID=2589382 RepID=UPI00355BA61B